MPIGLQDVLTWTDDVDASVPRAVSRSQIVELKLNEDLRVGACRRSYQNPSTYTFLKNIDRTEPNEVRERAKLGRRWSLCSHGRERSQRRPHSTGTAHVHDGAHCHHKSRRDHARAHGFDSSTRATPLTRRATRDPVRQHVSMAPLTASTRTPRAQAQAAPGTAAP